MGVIKRSTMLSAVTATGANTPGGDTAYGQKTFQAHGVTTAGAGAATIKIQGSIVASPTVDGEWVDIGTITLTLATILSSDGFTTDAPWPKLRANVTAISGTGANVTVLCGEIY